MNWKVEALVELLIRPVSNHYLSLRPADWIVRKYFLDRHAISQEVGEDEQVWCWPGFDVFPALIKLLEPSSRTSAFIRSIVGFRSAGIQRDSITWIRNLILDFSFTFHSSAKSMNFVRAKFIDNCCQSNQNSYQCNWSNRHCFSLL